MLTETSQHTVIALSKNKITLLVIGSIGFIALSTWLWTISETQIRYNPMTVKLASILGISFFGLCGVYGVIKLFDGKPGLVLSPGGIDDNSSGVAAGHIPWNEIIAIDIASVNSQKFLTFIVEKPEKYVERGNYIKRKLNSANLKYFGSPIQISSNALKVDFQELTEIVNQYYDKYKTQA